MLYDQHIMIPSYVYVKHGAHLWRLAFYTHVVNTSMTVQFHNQGRSGPIELLLLFHLLLKCLESELSYKFVLGVSI